MKRCIAILPSSAKKDPGVADILARYDEWPRSDALSRLGLERLAAHLQCCAELCNRIDDWLENHGLSSGQPAENFRPFKQNTREETQTVKTPLAVDNSERHAEIAQSELPSPISCPAPPTLTPENLYRIAGDGLRMMIDASRDQNRPLKERDIIEAAWALLPMLDIHASVWHDGQSTLGDHGLAFCLLLVDAQRDHPSYPVRNPGGLMRELIRRAKAGRLDFDASLAALQKRRNRVR